MGSWSTKLLFFLLRGEILYHLTSTQNCRSCGANIQTMSSRKYAINASSCKAFWIINVHILNHLRRSLLSIAHGYQRRTHQAYISLFICLSTKAIHFELVNDYTTNGFLTTFRKIYGTMKPPDYHVQ